MVHKNIIMITFQFIGKLIIMYNIQLENLYNHKLIIFVDKATGAHSLARIRHRPPKPGIGGSNPLGAVFKYFS